MMSRIAPYSDSATSILTRGEDFWREFRAPSSPQELLRFSLLLGILPFSGYLISYAVIGRIWNWFPWVQTLLPVTRAIMCAGLQWIFFSMFPVLSSFILEFLFGKKGKLPEVTDLILVCTYSMTPLFLASLIGGVPFFGRLFTLLAFSTFLYLLFFGYQIYLKQSVLRSVSYTLFVTFLFAAIRQMFVYVIGF